MKNQILISSKLKVAYQKLVYAKSNKSIINQIKTNPNISTIIIDIKKFKSLLKSQQQDLNPLTNLPGNKTIKKEIKKRLDNSLAILYIDLDNFKKYNDTYGFNSGDKIIKKIAKLLKNIIQKYGDKKDFLGHIGGDDFFIISTIDHAENLAQKICNFLNKKNNYLTLSIAIITNKKNTLTNISQVSQLSAKIKTYAKSKPGCIGKSNYVLDYNFNTNKIM
ncbi:GGDEF domain-containing protein [Candidatus Babeliales bacterium]|nr:GGDEF domain-containing protein [Candidatus Babeliales bacterium]